MPTARQWLSWAKSTLIGLLLCGPEYVRYHYRAAKYRAVMKAAMSGDPRAIDRLAEVTSRMLESAAKL